MSKDDFSEKLKSLRKEKKLTLKELASLSDTSDSYLSQLENSRRNPPKPELLKKIAKGLSNTKEDEAVIYAQLTVDAGYDIDNKSSYFDKIDMSNAKFLSVTPPPEFNHVKLANFVNKLSDKEFENLMENIVQLTKKAD